jgi:CheY-like chemotaxis protein
MRKSRPVLLVEDDDIDAMTVKRALQHLHSPNDLIHLNDGQEALEYLKAESGTKPSMIILDLDTPRMNGFELLETIKSDDMLKEIPVIVLTTSETKQDIEKSFSLSVAGYIVKPVDFDIFVETFGTINNYWSLSELPSDR